MRLRNERGLSTAMEAAILVPGILLLLGLLILGARMSLAQQAVDAAAAQAARAASIERTIPLADTAARDALARALAQQNITCSTTVVSLELSGLQRPIGAPSSVGVTVACTVSMADVSLPGIPGQFTITATKRSPVDAYRGR